MISMLMILMVLMGLFDLLSTLHFSIACTTSIPLVTRANTVCLLSNHGQGTVVMKN